MSAERIKLSAHNVGISFGGLRALNGVSMTLREGEIFSVIGPNGSGKTTFFNRLSGVYTQGEGSIHLADRTSGELVDVSRLGMFQRARLGMARTFQTLRLFEGMTVLDNVLTGFFQQQKVLAAAAIWKSKKLRQEEEHYRAKAIALLNRLSVDLTESKDKLAGSLPYAHRRRLEILRALATGPTVLMLDEPAAGMSRQEAMELAKDLEHIRDSGVSLVVIEHNMGFIKYLGGEVMVLSQGEVIAQGPYEAVSADQQVIAAYLGESDA